MPANRKQPKEKTKMSKSKIFLCFCLFFILGVGLRSFLNVSFFQNYLILLFSAIIAVFFFKKIGYLSFFGIFLFLGILIYNLQLPLSAPDKIYFYNNQKAVIYGSIREEPEIKINQQNLVISSEKIFVNYKWRKVSGKILVTVKLYPKYQYGDEIEIRGKLKSPQKIDNFDYPAYLFPKRIYSLSSFPEIKILANDRGNFFFNNILKLKNKFQSVINYSLPEPQASLFSGFLLGTRSTLPKELTDKFNKTGTSHIIAISGSHIVIIALILSNLFLLFNIKKKYSFYITSIFLSIFIILTGHYSSAIRSGIMGLLVLWAEKEGRLKNSLNALIFSAALMLFINPYLLRYDLGFQLSFLAVLGMIYFYPFFDKLNFFQKLPDFLKLKSNFLVTISAQLATLPLIIYQFRYYPFIAPLTNLLILPIFPFIMTLGFLFLFAGLIYLPLAKILFILVYLFLTYIIKVVEFFSF